MAMFCDRTVSAEPVRYTAATMEMMRLEDLNHIKCGVNYAHDHSHAHGAIQVSKNYFAEKEWAVKDQRKCKEISRAWKKDPERTRKLLLRKAKQSLHPPYAWDGPEFYGHKEASCMAYVSRTGKHRAELTGIDVDGSKPCFGNKSPLTRFELLSVPKRPRLPFKGAYSPRSRGQIEPLALVEGMNNGGTTKNIFASVSTSTTTRPPNKINKRPQSAAAATTRGTSFGGRREAVKNDSVSGSSSSMIGPQEISDCASRVAKRIQKLSSSNASSSNASAMNHPRKQRPKSASNNHAGSSSCVTTNSSVVY